MICFHCGNEVEEDARRCLFCGADLEAYREILYKAEAFYSDGLQKARVRDLSGAILSLREALRYSKTHTNARNLLGLCYFETGEVVKALREWVISKNLQPTDNAADRYLAELQTSPGTLSKLDATIKKYNQAIEYCRQGDRDLAKIQLKRVLTQNPRLVAGHQLLALLYLQDGKLEEAKKELLHAEKIDVNNTRTLRYLKECQSTEKEKKPKKKKRQKEEIVTFQDGNDSVVMPAATFQDVLNQSFGSFFNILLGVGFGLLISYFLIFPTWRSSKVDESTKALINANEEAVASANNIDALEQQVASLQTELEGYKGKEDLPDSYNSVIEALQDYANEDLDAAAEKLKNANLDFLEGPARTAYETIVAAHDVKHAEDLYNEGYQAYRRKDYETAAARFAEAMTFDENIMDGQLLYFLALSEQYTDKPEEAKEHFDKYVEQFPNGRYARDSRSRSAALEKEIMERKQQEEETSEEPEEAE